MYPVFASFNFLNKEIIIGSYGLLMVISFIFCSVLTLVLAKKKNYDSFDIINYLLLIISGGILSAFIVGLIYTGSIIKIRGMYSPPLISWGGFLGGIVVIIILKLTWKVEVLKLLDLISPGYALALSIGRIGCFFGGCCYGKHTDSWWGVYYTDVIAPASHSLQPLIPVQLISTVLLLLLTIILSYILLKSTSSGNTITVFLILYSISRFSLEYLRDDSRHFLFGLSDGQIYSILLLSAGILLIFRKRIILFFKTEKPLQ